MENLTDIEFVKHLQKLEKMIEDILTKIEKVEKKLAISGITEELIRTRARAAKFLDNADAQTIDTLLKEGRIINYGRDRLYLFHKSELLDIREIRNERD